MAIESPITSADKLFSGEDKVLRFLVLESDGLTPQDVTGWTVEYELYRHQSDAAPIFTKTSPTSITLLDPDSFGHVHVADVEIDASDTLNLEPGDYYHVLWRTDSGFHAVLAYGPVWLLAAGRIT